MRFRNGNIYNKYHYADVDCVRHNFYDNNRIYISSTRFNESISNFSLDVYTLIMNSIHNYITYKWVKRDLVWSNSVFNRRLVTSTGTCQFVNADSRNADCRSANHCHWQSQDHIAGHFHLSFPTDTVRSENIWWHYYE